MNLGSIADLFAHEIAALQSTADQLLEALPKVRDAADDAKLTKAIDEHSGRVERWVDRLAQVVDAPPVDVPTEKSKPVEAMLTQVDAILTATGPVEVRDAALVAEIQRIVHYEIASYGTARAIADQLDLREAVDLLGETLREEIEFDELLTKLATGGFIVSGLNERAQG
jgi:ferritin-like metal-binding protein YciE